MRLRWTSEAIEQPAEVRFYIAQDNPTAALATARTIRDAASRLMRFPLSGRLDPEIGARVSSIPRTPYRLHYVVAGDEIRILSVWHGARQWQPPA